MKWEIDRHDWTGIANVLPGWIEELIDAESSDRANELLCLIESSVSPVNGPLQMGADAVASCMVQGLLSATATARTDILYLLFQLAGGTVGVAESKMVRDVRREIGLGLPIFCELAETGTRAERFQCIDLLSLCARFDEPTMARVISTMRQIAKLGEDEANAVAVEVEEIRPTRPGCQ